MRSPLTSTVTSFCVLTATTPPTASVPNMPAVARRSGSERVLLIRLMWCVVDMKPSKTYVGVQFFIFPKVGQCHHSALTLQRQDLESQLQPSGQQSVTIR